MQYERKIKLVNQDEIILRGREKREFRRLNHQVFLRFKFGYIYLTKNKINNKTKLFTQTLESEDIYYSFFLAYFLFIVRSININNSII